MTCFWQGLIRGISAAEFETTMAARSKPTVAQFIKFLKDNNKYTLCCTWNGDILTAKQLYENYDAVETYNPQTAPSGYLCSTFDPFLFLVVDLFKINIDHNYNGTLIRYRRIHNRRTMRAFSDTGHFWT